MHERASKTDTSDLASGHRARLRQKLLDAGPKGFHDYELVEYLLTLTIPRVDTKPLAKRLIDSFGGIGPLLAASADTLRREGVTDAAITALKIAHATPCGCSRRVSKAARSSPAGMRWAITSTRPWPTQPWKRSAFYSSMRRTC